MELVDWCHPRSPCTHGKWGETKGQTGRGFCSKRTDNGLKQGSGDAQEGVAEDTWGLSARGLATLRGARRG